MAIKIKISTRLLPLEMWEEAMDRDQAVLMDPQEVWMVAIPIIVEVLQVPLGLGVPRVMELVVPLVTERVVRRATDLLLMNQVVPGVMEQEIPLAMELEAPLAMELVRPQVMERVGPQVMERAAPQAMVQVALLEDHMVPVVLQVMDQGAHLMVELPVAMDLKQRHHISIKFL